MLDRIDSMETTLPRNTAALAHDRMEAAQDDRAARHVAGGLGRAADSAHDLTGGFLSFFEPGGPPPREPRETADERIERLASSRNEIRRIENQEIAEGRAYVAARELEDERGRERERERDRLK